ncbi:alpha-hydroxy-acid oxidizing enzyme [Epidermidibacterium keratini]|uniref:Alpha-hydroxy-acid oxidizing enzyme n=2 Tax=Epidermidibacterium keratini TaxID=1891644 RepID=A0A7L4YWK0_9ACTN|nr:alpha-hydroxy-acid oxidizing enzyme [Epidermidibacterium keratini]
MPKITRQVPKLSELKPLLGFQGPTLKPAARRLSRAFTIADLRKIAKRRTPRSVFDYTDGAAEDESSLARSRDLFTQVEFEANVLRDISKVNLETTILGGPSSLPIALAPTGFTRMMHYQGETAVAHEANNARIPYSLSTMGTTSIEEVAKLTPDTQRYFQLYVWNDREASTALIERARDAGYQALILTVDTAVAGNRRRDVRNGLTIPPKLTPSTFADMAMHPSWWANLLTTAPLEFASLTNWEGTVAEMINKMFDPTVSFEDVAWLRSIWPGKLVVKGIQSLEDSQRALDVGADALLLSNHGGRQLGRARPPLRLLPEARRKLGDDVEIFIDGGIMGGEDVIACLALGADAAFIGRAYLYGLMAGGYLGVRRAIDILRTEMRRTMQLLGVSDVKDLGPQHVHLT